MLAVRADGIGACFKVQLGGYSVEQVHVLAEQGRGMTVYVDETGGYREAAGIDRPLRLQRSFGNGDNGAASDTDMALGVQTGFRIDDASVSDHQVIVVCHNRNA